MSGDNNSSMGKLSGAMKYFAFGTQMVLSIIMPFVVLIWLAAKARDKFGWGDWTVGVSIVLALIISVCDCIHMGKLIIKQARRDGSMAALLAKQVGIKVKSKDDLSGKDGGAEEMEPPAKREDVKAGGIRGSAAGDGAWKSNQPAEKPEPSEETAVDPDLMPPPLPNYFTSGPNKDNSSGSGEDSADGQ